jgi:hypothetical protein
MEHSLSYRGITKQSEYLSFFKFLRFLYVSNDLHFITFRLREVKFLITFYMLTSSTVPLTDIQVGKFGRWVARLGIWVAKLGRWVARLGSWVASQGDGWLSHGDGWLS